MTRYWIVGLGIVMLVLGIVLPNWIAFQLALALAKGMVVLGVVLLLRGGLISFGQALFYAVGAYSVGFVMQQTGIRELAILLPLATLTGGVLAALIGLFIVRYRQIFFAMLSLAFSMVLYGVLLRFRDVTGGSDGLAVPSASLLGMTPDGADYQLMLYMVTGGCLLLVSLGIHQYLRSPAGYTMQALRDNELRVEYLGTSAQQTIYITYVLAGALGSLGGALVAFNVGYIDPQYAFWTTSAEFVVMAVLGGTGSVAAPVTGAIVFEFVRIYATQYAVSSWRLVLGVVLLLVILFLPGGLWVLIDKLTTKGREWLPSFSKQAD